MARKAIESCVFITKAEDLLMQQQKRAMQDREERWRYYFHEFSELHNDDGTRPSREECAEYANSMMEVKKTK